jgi:hypothetical protein
MLMSGSLGMVASTLPVQALLPVLGWRNLFLCLAALLVVAMTVIGALTPKVTVERHSSGLAVGGYRPIISHPAFVRAAPLAFFTYGGLIAVQSLWAGPWLTAVVQTDAVGAARGLFIINLSMLGSFLTWGIVMPRLAKGGVGPERLVAWGWPLGALVLVAIIALGGRADAPWLAAWCVCTSVVTLCQPAVAQAFPKAQAGRALAAFNLLIFFGVFACQWGMGLLIDALVSAGWEPALSHRAAMAALLIGTVVAGAWFWVYPHFLRRTAFAGAR